MTNDNKNMTLKEIIEQLKSLRNNSESFLDKDAMDDETWRKDIRAIDMVLDILEDRAATLASQKRPDEITLEGCCNALWKASIQSTGDPKETNALYNWLGDMEALGITTLRKLQTMCELGWQRMQEEKKAHNMNRDEILDAAKEAVNRNPADPAVTHRRIASLWETYLTAESGLPIRLTGIDAAHMMVLLKLAREQSSHNPDNYVDMAGYAACAGEMSRILECDDSENYDGSDDPDEYTDA